MVAAFLQLNHRSTAIAPLPPSLFRGLKQSIRFLIFRAFFGAMPLAVTQTAYLHLATSTLPIFLSIFLVDITWFYPLSTASTWTIYPVLRGIFLVLFVPIYLEINIK